MTAKPMKSTNDKIDETAQEIYQIGFRVGQYTLMPNDTLIVEMDNAKSRLIQLIKETLQECIGEEEELGVDMPPYVEHLDYAERKGRNQLRQSQSTKQER